VPYSSFSCFFHKKMSCERHLSRLLGLDKLGEQHGDLILIEIDAAKSWDERIRWEDRQQAGKATTLVGM
jgi:hypothetical protein